MEEEMEMPAADELEWLEREALIPEEEEEYQEFLFQAEDQCRGTDLPDAPVSKTSDPLPLSPKEASRKRHCSDEGNHGSPALDSGEKSAKRRAVGEDGDSDDDWLHYLPQKDVNTDESPRDDDPLNVDYREKLISRFASEIEGECIPITGPNGDRVYARVCSANDGGHPSCSFKGKSIKGLLSDPINLLIERVEQEAFVEALRESCDPPGKQIHSTIPTRTEQVWVDKYAPNSFTELLSDEQTNREVLLWLKQWDSCVFGSHVRATEDDVLFALRRHASTISHQKYSSDSSSFTMNKRPFNCQNPKARETEDSNLFGFSDLCYKNSMVNHPPEQKVLLLCGSPGLGKTTLAHVAAKHCGYRVVEINASDDRSSSTVESKILDVVQISSVLGDSKPKCLVIDEIDGALGEGKGAIDVILKLVAAENKSSSERGHTDREGQPHKNLVKKGHRTTPLSRPVICICNDLYAPALRSLRQVAKVHLFVQPTINRVVSRLKYICRKEGFKTNSSALSALAECTECDIRACVNTLQFLNKKKEVLNILDINSQVVGRKDVSKSAFDVWKEVLQKRKSKNERKSMNSCVVGSAGFDTLYSILSNSGEYELIMDGIYENFLQLSYLDPLMQKTVKSLDALGVSDMLTKFVLRSQQMPLLVYQPSMAITISSLTAQITKPSISWPKSLQRYRTILAERKDMLKIWGNKILPLISRHISIDSFVQDIVSLFLDILSPLSMRPVALNLLSDKEKDDFVRLVENMVTYSITYRNSKSESGQKHGNNGGTSDIVLFSFDPPIHNLIDFKDHQSEHIWLSLAMKKVLAHEVEKQKILRENNGKLCSTPASNSEHPNIANSVPKSQLEDHKKGVPFVNKSKSLGDSRRTLNCSSSFFDRFREGSKTSNKNTMQKIATAERDSRPLLFKYNEGFTNAVKRPIKVRELL